MSFLKRTRSFAARELKDEDGSERTLLGFSPRRRGGHAAADRVSVCLHSEVSPASVDVHSHMTIRTLGSTLRKILHAPDLPDRHYCTAGHRSVRVFLWSLHSDRRQHSPLPRGATVHEQDDHQHMKMFIGF